MDAFCVTSDLRSPTRPFMSPPGALRADFSGAGAGAADGCDVCDTRGAGDGERAPTRAGAAVNWTAGPLECAPRPCCRGRRASCARKPLEASARFSSFEIHGSESEPNFGNAKSGPAAIAWRISIAADATMLLKHSASTLCGCESAGISLSRNACSFATLPKKLVALRGLKPMAEKSLSPSSFTCRTSSLLPKTSLGHVRKWCSVGALYASMAPLSPL